MLTSHLERLLTIRIFCIIKLNNFTVITYFTFFLFEIFLTRASKNRNNRVELDKNREKLITRQIKFKFENLKLKLCQEFNLSQVKYSIIAEIASYSNCEQIILTI
jgi:hypothetical protein